MVYLPEHRLLLFEADCYRQDLYCLVSDFSVPTIFLDVVDKQRVIFSFILFKPTHALFLKRIYIHI